MAVEKIIKIRKQDVFHKTKMFFGDKDINTDRILNFIELVLSQKIKEFKFKNYITKKKVNEKSNRRCKKRGRKRKYYKCKVKRKPRSDRSKRYAKRIVPRNGAVV